MPLYAHTIQRIKEMIRKDYFRIEKRFCDVDEIDMREVILDGRDSQGTARFRLCQYILWMFDEVETMTNTRKADRWMGWALDRMEIMGFATNKESRELVRVDKEAGRA